MPRKPREKPVTAGMQRVWLYLPAVQLRAVKELANKTGYKYSDLIRRGVDMLLEKWQEKGREEPSGQGKE